MKVIVTGASGYVGRRLMTRLPNAEALPRVDLSNFAAASSALAPWRWDAIVNLAGPAPKATQPWREESACVATHVRIAMNLARLVPRSARLVHMSGMIVYGLPETRPVKEEHTRKPIHSYGLAKMLAEDALASVEDVWILRVGGLFSEDRTEGALYHFLRAAKERRKLVVSPKTPLAWDPHHVDDAVEAIVRALDLHGEGALNVSTSEPLDLLGVARRIASRYGGEVEDAGGVAHPVFQSDTTKLRSRFGWTPVPLDERLDAWWSSM